MSAPVGWERIDMDHITRRVGTYTRAVCDRDSDCWVEKNLGSGWVRETEPAYMSEARAARMAVDIDQQVRLELSKLNAWNESVQS